MINKYLRVKKFFIRVLLLLPIVYIGFGWYVGLNYARKTYLLQSFLKSKHKRSKKT